MGALAARTRRIGAGLKDIGNTHDAVYCPGLNFAALRKLNRQKMMKEWRLVSRRVEAEITVMCMLCNGSKVLVQERLDKNWPGIAFPGGHVELDESFSQAAVREMLEETGLKIEDPRLCGVKSVLFEEGRRYIVFLFTACQFTRNIQSSEEGEVFWVERSQLPDMNLCSTMGELLPVFFEEQYTEFFNDRTKSGNNIQLF